MVNDEKSIVLISKDPGVSSSVGRLLKSFPNVKLNQCEATLSEMNGRASRLAVSNDLIIFRCEGKTDSDVAAVQGIQRRNPEGAVLLALTDANTTLADIRRLTRAGVREVLPDTVTAAELQDFIQRWTVTDKGSAPAVSAPPAKAGKVISVTKARGGAGSTTLAVNLADQLVGRTGLIKKCVQNRVALVDLDMQFGDISSFLDIEPSEALYQMAMDGRKPDETFLSQSMTQTSAGMAVFPAPSRFAPLSALQKPQVKALITLLQAEYDWVVVDLPRALVEWISPVLELSDRLMMVTDCSVPAVSQARRLMDIYSEDNPTLKVEIVVNRERKPMVMGRHHTEAAKVLEQPLRYWLPNDPKAATEAIDRGKPLSVVSGRSSLTKGIHRIARHVISEAGAETTLSKTVH